MNLLHTAFGSRFVLSVECAGASYWYVQTVCRVGSRTAE